MAWDGPRSASSIVTTTAKWKRLRTFILHRDGYDCQIRYTGCCTGNATVVDKIIPASQRADLAFNPTNLRAACKECNDRKARSEDKPSDKYPTERHPAYRW